MWSLTPSTHQTHQWHRPCSLFNANPPHLQHNKPHTFILPLLSLQCAVSTPSTTPAQTWPHTYAPARLLSETCSTARWPAAPWTASSPPSSPSNQSMAATDRTAHREPAAAQTALTNQCTVVCTVCGCGSARCCQSRPRCHWWARRIPRSRHEAGWGAGEILEDGCPWGHRWRPKDGISWVVRGGCEGWWWSEDVACLIYWIKIK